VSNTPQPWPGARLSLLVDVAIGPRHVAMDDLVCFRGRWRTVTAIDKKGSCIGFEDPDLGGVTQWAYLTDFPLARIAAPLLELAKAASTPYR